MGSASVLHGTAVGFRLPHTMPSIQKDPARNNQAALPRSGGGHFGSRSCGVRDDSVEGVGVAPYGWGIGYGRLVSILLVEVMVNVRYRSELLRVTHIKFAC